MSSPWVPVVIMLVIVLVAAGIYVVVKLRKRDAPKRELLDEAKTEVADFKAASDADLAAELEIVTADKAQLEAIASIKDEDARLAELAKYGNRRRK